MINMKKYLLLFVALLWTSIVSALPYDNNLNSYGVELPTTYVDGTSISPGDLKAIVFYWRLPNDTFNNTNRIVMTLADGTSPVDFLADQINAKGLADDNYQIAFTTYVDPSMESGFSPEVTMPVINGIAQKGDIANLPIPKSITIPPAPQ